MLLQNGSREEIDRKTGRLDVLTFAEDTIDLATNSKNDETRMREVSEMSPCQVLPGKSAAMAA